MRIRTRLLLGVLTPALLAGPLAASLAIAAPPAGGLASAGQTQSVQHTAHEATLTASTRSTASGGAYSIIASPCLWDHQWRVGDFPSASLPRIRCWSFGSTVHVVCWYQGQSINGDNFWDQILEDDTNDYAAIAADFYINTGSNNPNDAGIPACG